MRRCTSQAVQQRRRRLQRNWFLPHGFPRLILKQRTSNECYRQREEDRNEVGNENRVEAGCYTVRLNCDQCVSARCFTREVTPALFVMYRKQPGTETEWIRKGPGSAQTLAVDEELTDRLLPVQDAMPRLTAGFVAMEFRGCGRP